MVHAYRIGSLRKVLICLRHQFQHFYDPDRSDFNSSPYFQPWGGVWLCDTVAVAVTTRRYDCRNERAVFRRSGGTLDRIRAKFLFDFLLQ